MQEHADKEEGQQPGTELLDVCTPPGSQWCEGEGYGVEVLNIHLVQRLEEFGRGCWRRTGSMKCG